MKIAVFVPWIRLRRAILAASVGVRKTLAEDLDAITELLAAPGTSKGEADGLYAKVAALQARLRKEQAALMRNEIQRLKDDLGTLLDVDARTPIAAQLDRAQGFVAGDDGSPEEAGRELAVANQQLAQALRVRLEDLLANPTPPTGMDASSWVLLQGQTRSALAGASDADGSAAIRAVRAADGTLLRGILDAATGAVTDKRRALPDPLSGVAEKQAQAFDEVLGHLGEARAALAKGDMAAAHTAYDLARVGMEAARTKGFLRASSGGELAVPPALPATAPAVGDVGAIQLPDVVVLPLPRDVRREWQWYERILATVTLGVGVLVGLLALYNGNPTWGSLGDVLLAVLWGAGLYQVTGALQQGFGGVRTALTS